MSFRRWLRLLLLLATILLLLAMSHLRLGIDADFSIRDLLNAIAGFVDAILDITRKYFSG